MTQNISFIFKKKNIGPTIPYLEDFSSYANGSSPGDVANFTLSIDDGLDEAIVYNDGQGNSYISLDSDQNGDQVYNLQFNYRIIGDFDIRTTHNRITAQDPSSSVHYSIFRLKDDVDNKTIQISMAQHSTSPYVYFQTYDSGGLRNNDIIGYPSNFLLRLTRSGSTLRAYYWSGSGWSSARTSIVSTSNPMTIELTYKQESNARWKVTWDDFNIVSGGGLELIE